MKHYDHIILGTGQATGTLLGKLIATGDSIAVIEKGNVGGSCVNYGCTPTKTLVASARAIHLARRGDEFGFKTGELTIDYPTIRARMNQIRNGNSNGMRKWLETTENIDFYPVKGSFIGDKVLQVGDTQIGGKNIYINTGTRPRIPNIEGVDGVNWLDTASLLDKTELPKHLIIVGGGYIGVEFAQVYRRFGSKVTLIQLGNQLMPREDGDIAAVVDEILREEGVNIVYNAKAVSTKEDSSGIHLTIQKDDVEETITGSDILFAIGRIANSDQIGLEHTAISKSDRGFIDVDDYCQTAVEGVYALGDVNGKGAFTHTSVNDAEIVLDKLFGGVRSISQRIPVYALFTDPPLGRVGMSEKEALASGKKVLKATYPLSRIGRAKEMAETKGFAKLLVDAETDLIIGGAILGINGDEIINMFAAIMHSGIPCKNYRRVVLVHPTVSELMPWMLDGIKEAIPIN